MDFNTFSKQIVTAPYERGDDVVNLKINIDTFTPEYFRSVAERLKSRQEKLNLELKAATNGNGNGHKPGMRAKKATKQDKAKEPTEMETMLETFERSAKALEVERAVYAEFLYPNVLVGWDLTEGEEKTPVELTLDLLLGLPPRLVRELWDFCTQQAAVTVKKAETTPSPTTSENTSGGSMVGADAVPAT